MIKIASNGQWTLAKSDESEPKGPAPTSLHKLIGKTHTVEVHPHIDHLYRLKNFITQSAQAMPIRAIKQSEFGHLADKLPRDAKGNVTPEMIDKHIASLPKHKVEVKVVPYKMGAQQHREDVPQYVASVGLHPDTIEKMSPNKKNTWDFMRKQQHDLGGHEHQVGWARIDPYKITNPGEASSDQLESIAAMERLLSMTTDPEARDTIRQELTKYPSRPSVVPNDKHWHIDEIQSDFGVPNTIKQHIHNYTDPEEIARNVELDAYDIFHQRSNPHSANLPAEELHKKFVEKHPELAEDLDKYLERRQKRKDTHEAIHNKYREQGLVSSPNALATDASRYWTDNQQQKAKKIQEELDANIKHWDKQDKPWDDKVGELAKKYAKDREGPSAKHMHDLLSHGHEDPMHMVHSAVNQLGRQNGIESMSMDTPNHQAHQSGLRPSNERDDPKDKARVHIMDGNVTPEHAKVYWEDYGPGAIAHNMHDVNFKSAYDKLGPKGLEDFANLVSRDNSSWLFGGGGDNWDEEVSDDMDNPLIPPETRKKLQNLTSEQKDALSRFARHYNEGVLDRITEQLGLDDDGTNMHADEAEYDLPVHQINTYDKRPKKLGFQTVDKKKILGEHPDDQYNEVQYAKLHKKLRLIQELLRKTND